MAAVQAIRVVLAMAFPITHAQTWRPDKAIEIVIGTTPGAPHGMSAASIAYSDTTLLRVIKAPEWLKDLENGLMANVYKNSAETLKHWQAEYADVKALFSAMELAK